MDRNACLKLLAMLILVALRKESVDRNHVVYLRLFCLCGFVALRKESVDRNQQISAINGQSIRRSPQGERG